MAVKAMRTFLIADSIDCFLENSPNHPNTYLSPPKAGTKV